MKKKIINVQIDSIGINIFDGMTRDQMLAELRNRFDTPGHTNVKVYTESDYDGYHSFTFRGDREETDQELAAKLKRQKAGKLSAAKKKERYFEKIQKEAKKLGII